jgi:predicted branched-subunit amino acid permease
MQRTTYLEGARRAWPLAVAVGGFGVTYGVLARQAGFSALAVIATAAGLRAIS